MLHALGVTTWDIVMEALARMKPRRDRKWLQKNLDLTAQAMTNWKKAGEIPPQRYMQVCDLIGLTAEQLTGRAPLPWDIDANWPFPDIERERFTRLSETQRGEIQAKVRELIETFEEQKRSSGKSSGSQSGAPRQRAA